MAFDTATRRVLITLPVMTKPTGGGIATFNLPKTGLLARLWLPTLVTITGTLTAPNALGLASVIRRLRLTANSGIDIWNQSGAIYQYVARNFHNIYFDPALANAARSAVAVVTNNDLSSVMEIQLNQKDPIGLIMLQNEQTLLTLTGEFETDSVVATGATVTATITPVMEFFNVPQNPQDWPPLNIVHQQVEDQQSIGATGDFTYYWPRGNTYVAMYHGFGIGATPADNFSRVRVRVNQSLYLYDVLAPTAGFGFLDLEYQMNHPYARPKGAIPIDLIGSAGLGALPEIGKPRDFINSAALTDLATIITATATGTLFTTRRQLVSLG